MHKKWKLNRNLVLRLLGALLIGIGVFALIGMNKPPHSKVETIALIEKSLEKSQQALAQKNNDFSGIQVRITSPKRQIDYSYASGTTRHGTPLNTSTPFHTASVGKLMTAVAIGQLVDEGKLTFETPIVEVLGEKAVEGLFTVKGVSYASKVTINQLLDHTSGVADYFEDKDANGNAFIDRLTTEKNEHWTPDKLIGYTKTHLKAVAPPGETYHYSDTGFILLGQIIEKKTQKPLHAVYRERFFEPLGLKDTYLSFGGEPVEGARNEMADVWLSGVEMSTFESLSADWAGGGIISTLKDLDVFQRALHDGKLVSKTTYDHLFTIHQQFLPGIHYGYGTMEIRFEEFMFLLKGLPRLKGHIGILSTHLFYDPVSETSIVMNFGSDACMEASFKVLIEIMRLLHGMQSNV